MARKSTAKKATAEQKIHMPKFHSEAEEARWHDSLEGRRFWQQQSAAAKARGTVTLPQGEAFPVSEKRIVVAPHGLDVPLTDPKVLAALEKKALSITTPVSLRLPAVDIQRARELANARGTRYQTLLKEFIREGLSRASANKPASK